MRLPDIAWAVRDGGFQGPSAGPRKKSSQTLHKWPLSGYDFLLRCGNSSVGRARPCQGRGREFESRFPLQCSAKPRHSGVLFFQADGDPFRLRSVRNGLVAEWSCSGLQSRVRRFDSDPGLHCDPNQTRLTAGFSLHAPLRAPVARMLGCASFRIGPDGETGRRKGLKIPHPQGYDGSIPSPGTMTIIGLRLL